MRVSRERAQLLFNASDGGRYACVLCAKRTGGGLLVVPFAAIPDSELEAAEPGQGYAEKADALRQEFSSQHAPGATNE